VSAGSLHAAAAPRDPSGLAGRPDPVKSQCLPGHLSPVAHPPCSCCCFCCLHDPALRCGIGSIKSTPDPGVINQQDDGRHPRQGTRAESVTVTEQIPQLWCEGRREADDVARELLLLCSDDDDDDARRRDGSKESRPGATRKRQNRGRAINRLMQKRGRGRGIGLGISEFGSHFHLEGRSPTCELCNVRPTRHTIMGHIGFSPSLSLFHHHVCVFLFSSSSFGLGASPSSFYFYPRRRSDRVTINIGVESFSRQPIGRHDSTTESTRTPPLSYLLL